jgi:putative glutamine amidotransferase
MRIGITDCLREDKLQQYLDWIRKVDSNVEFVKLSCAIGNIDAISDVDGLLLTGGGDVDPDFYDCAHLWGQAKDINIKRDEFEFEIIKRSLGADLPILGVCRGMQVMNVALGGSLYVDLKSNGFNDHSISINGGLKHAVTIEPNSLLSGLAGALNQEVNSYHHQAVDKLGKGLTPTAESPDGVIEAAEWSSKEGMSFLLLVQWHPERTIGDNDLFSNNLARIFLREIEYSTTTKATYTSRR